MSLSRAARGAEESSPLSAEASFNEGRQAVRESFARALNSGTTTERSATRTADGKMLLPELLTARAAPESACKSCRSKCCCRRSCCLPKLLLLEELLQELLLAKAAAARAAAAEASAAKASTAEASAARAAAARAVAARAC